MIRGQLELALYHELVQRAVCLQWEHSSTNHTVTWRGPLKDGSLHVEDSSFSSANVSFLLG